MGRLETSATLSSKPWHDDDEDDADDQIGKDERRVVILAGLRLDFVWTSAGFRLDFGLTLVHRSEAVRRS